MILVKNTPQTIDTSKILKLNEENDEKFEIKIVKKPKKR